MGKTATTKKATATKNKNDDLICKSCGEKGHGNARSHLCKNNKINQEKFDPKKKEKELVKAEKVEKAIEQADLSGPIDEAQKEIDEMNKKIEEMKKKQEEELKKLQDKKKKVEEEQKKELEKKWKKDDEEHRKKYHEEYIKTCQELKINPSEAVWKMYQSGRGKEYVSLPKPWEKCVPIKKEKKSGGGGGGGGPRISGPRPCNECQARGWYKCDGKSTRPDFCGKEKVPGTDFCEKHQKTRKDGIMNDGIIPNRVKNNQERYDKLVNCPTYGAENKKQMGIK